MIVHSATLIQRYALDSRGNLVDAENVIKNSETFFCLSCHREMILKQGKIRKWHFAHKTNCENCSYESYLHKLAKIRLCEWFNNATEINIYLEWANECPDIKNCFWANASGNLNCKKNEHRYWNLKKHYLSCEIEKDYGGFKADLFLSYKGEKEEPIFIEICVTHPCDDNKINSGIRIIEFTISSEKDIDEIINQPIKAGATVKLYNFKPKSTTPYNNPIKLHKFTIGSLSRISTEIMSCKDSETPTKGLLELIIMDKDFYSNDIFRDIGVAIAAKYFLSEKFCDLCKWRDDGQKRVACKLFKTRNNNKYSDPKQAWSCSDYERDLELIEEKANQLNCIPHIINLSKDS